MQQRQSIHRLEQKGLCGIDDPRAPYDCRIDAWLLSKQPGIDGGGEESQKLQAMARDGGNLGEELKKGHGLVSVAAVSMTESLESAEFLTWNMTAFIQS